jgi:hypothetical protein
VHVQHSDHKVIVLFVANKLRQVSCSRFGLSRDTVWVTNEYDVEAEIPNFDDAQCQKHTRDLSRVRRGVLDKKVYLVSATILRCQSV